MFRKSYGNRPMKVIPIDSEADHTEPFMTLKQAVDSLPFFKRYGVVKRAIVPVAEAKLSELLKVDFDGQIRARVAYINRHIDRLYYNCREDVVTYILPRLVRTALHIQEQIEGTS